MRQHEDIPYDTVGVESMMMGVDDSAVMLTGFIFIGIPVALILYLIIRGANKR